MIQVRLRSMRSTRASGRRVARRSACSYGVGLVTAVLEAALYAAHAPDPAAARTECVAAFELLIDGLTGTGLTGTG